MNRSSRSGPARWAVVVAAFAAAATLVGACGSSDDDEPASGSSAGAPRPGGTLTFAVGSDAGCVDPQQAGSNDTVYSLRQIVDSLTDQDPRTGEIVPWLAERWEISPDARTFTFHLRPGATFSDGTPVNARSVKDNFDAIPKLGALAVLGTGYLSGYEGTTVVDDLTAAVAFKQSNAQFLQATSTFSLGLVSGASIAKTPQQRCGEGVIGSGPFVLSKYEPAQAITLTKRTGYNWGSSLWTKKGEAYLDTLAFKVVPEAGVRSASLTSGQVDAIGSVSRADEAALRGGGANLQARANPGVVFNLGLNNSRPILQDQKVRQAILFAIDRKQIADTVFPTGTQPATSILAHTTPSYKDLGSDLRFDAAQARSLLDAAGWVPGADGIRRKDGVPLRLTVSWFANAATNKSTLELIQQQLKAVGADIVLKELQIAQAAQLQRSGDFDVLWGNLTRADPDILRTLYSTQLANAYRLPPTQLDSVLTAQAAEPDPAKRRDLVAQAQQLIVQNAYVIPVVELQTELGVSKNVHNLDFEASSRIQLHDTWKS
ncbi:ABC transporter substrate-binding protein [Candidatus Frankia meridionalis]|uniref:ABC-type transporter, periplasmic subunit n=1 Tax=Candidatus Protofrankia datiscae TaxID=2716812 RepID=F8B0X3_9ACTN|nr:ABC-type transporter, periplasmic subunit [Candidatus Protofrankia datiscae]